jgi:hypothetical protein
MEYLKAKSNKIETYVYSKNENIIGRFTNLKWM